MKERDQYLLLQMKCIMITSSVSHLILNMHRAEIKIYCKLKGNCFKKIIGMQLLHLMFVLSDIAVTSSCYQL